MKHPTHSMLAVAGTVLCYMADGAPATGAADSNAADAQRLLQQWVQALGGADALAQFKTLYFRSTIETAGLTGTVEEWYAASGLMRQHVVIGDVMEQWTVFDGTECWQRDRNGKVRRLSGAERENTLTGAALNSFAHLLPGRMAVKAEVVAASDGPALRISPVGGRSIVVVLDPKTSLPLRQEQPEAERTRVTTFSDWRESNGIRFPFEMRSTVGDSRSDSLVRLVEVQRDPAVESSTFQKPEEGARDYHFTSGNSARDIPFELTSNHIYIRTRVNHSEPLWLLLDTGAGASVLNTSSADRLGLKGQGKLEGRGAGEGSVDVSMLSGVSFQLPGVELTNQTVATIPLSALEPYEGRKMDGILGYDFLSRFVVEIDYAGKRVHLYDARGYEYTGSGESIPIVLEDGIVFARAKVVSQKAEPVEGKFTIDTGARSALSLNKPFIETRGVTPNDGKLLDAIQGIGVGGENKGKVARIAQLQFGQFKFDNPVAGFSQDAKGALADPEGAGIIGGEILRRFTLIVDYERERLILEPNAALADPFTFDASGAFLIADGADLEGIKVHRVQADSPAAQAGVKEGDHVVQVDGNPVSGADLDATRRRLREAGQRVRLELKRGTETLSVQLELRQLI